MQHLLTGERRRTPEVMDDPALDPAEHAAALRGLRRLNIVSRSAAILWPAIRRLHREVRGRLRVLDVASGAGDLPLWLSRRARATGTDLEIHGTDVSPQAVEFARHAAAAQGAEVEFRRLDVLRDELPRGFDVVTSSLFFHHLAEEEAVELLRKMADAARRLVLVSDLRRGVAGWTLAAVASRLLTRSPVVHTDALRSVAGAFTVQELRRVAQRAGLPTATIEHRWPCRMLLSWSKP